MISIIIFFSSLLLHCFNLFLKKKKISFFNSSHHVKRKILIAEWKFNEEDTWQISRTRFKAGECWSLNNDAGSRRLISLKRRLRLVPESARVVNVFPTPFLLCRWSRGSSWKFMTLWNRVAELLGWGEEGGERNNFESAQTQGGVTSVAKHFWKAIASGDYGGGDVRSGV